MHLRPEYLHPLSDLVSGYPFFFEKKDNVHLSNYLVYQLNPPTWYQSFADSVLGVGGGAEFDDCAVIHVEVGWVPKTNPGSGPPNLAGQKSLGGVHFVQTNHSSSPCLSPSRV